MTVPALDGWARLAKNLKAEIDDDLIEATNPIGLDRSGISHAVTAFFDRRRTLP